MNGIGFWLQSGFSESEIPFEVHSEIPKIEILFRKFKKLKAV